MNYFSQYTMDDKEVNNISYYLRKCSFRALDEASEGESDHEEVGFAAHYAVRLYATSIALIFVCDEPKKILIYEKNFFSSFYFVRYILL